VRVSCLGIGSDRSEQSANREHGIGNPLIVDHQPVRKSLSGHPFAERALYDAHLDGIYRVMHRMAGEPDLAADFTPGNIRRTAID
jgi:hypothetical protein